MKASMYIYLLVDALTIL